MLKWMFDTPRTRREPGVDREQRWLRRERNSRVCSTLFATALSFCHFGKAHQVSSHFDIASAPEASPVVSMVDTTVERFVSGQLSQGCISELD